MSPPRRRGSSYSDLTFMKNNLLIPYLQLALSMFFVGSIVIVGKFLSSISIFHISFISLFAASVVYLFILSKKKNIFRIPVNVFFIILFQAFFGTFMYRILLLNGLKFVSGSQAGIITSLTPATIAIISFLILKEKLTFKKDFGIILSVFGLLLVTANASNFKSTTNNFIFGEILIFLSVLSESFFIILSKFLPKDFDPIHQSALITFFSTIMFFPFILNSNFINTVIHLSAFNFLTIIYYGVILSVVAFILFFNGMKRVSASTTGIFTAVSPLSSIILSNLILHESLSINQIVGGSLIVISILVINKS